MALSYDEIRESCLVSMKEALGTDIGSDDVSFFALGGTSSTAVRWMLNLAERTGLEVGLAEIFDCPSPSELAFVLHDRTRPHATELAPTVVWHRASEKQALRLEATRYSRTEDVNLTNANSEILVVGVRLQGPLEKSAMSRAVEAVIDRHDLLRAFFNLDGPPYRLSVMDRAFGLEYWQKDDLADLYRPFSFDSGQLARFVLVERAQDHHELWLAVEHVAADRDSLYLILADIATFYNRLVRGHHLGDVAHRGLRGSLVGEYEENQAATPAGQESRDLYRQQLGDGPPWRPLELRLAHKSSGDATARLESGETLSRRELETLHERCAAGAVSLTAAIVHSVSASFYQVLGISDLTLYCVVGNRSSELSETVAPLASVVPIRVQQDQAHDPDHRQRCAAVVNRALAKTAYHFDRYARENDAWGAYLGLPIVVVNIFVKSALDPFDMDRLDVQEIPAGSAVPDKMVVTFHVDYDSDGLNLTVDAPTGLMSEDDLNTVLETAAYELRGAAS